MGLYIIYKALRMKEGIKEQELQLQNNTRMIIALRADMINVVSIDLSIALKCKISLNQV